METWETLRKKFAQAVQSDQPEIALLCSDQANSEGEEAWKQGLFQKSRNYFEVALEMRQSLPGCPPEKLGESWNNLGLVFKSLGQYVRSKDCYERALECYEQNAMDQSPFFLHTLTNLALLQKSMYAYPEALYLARWAVQKANELPQPDPDLTARLLNNLGSILQELGSVEGARSRFEESLRLRLGLGDNTLLVAESYNNLGMLFLQNDAPKEAQEYFQKAFALVEEKLPENHPYHFKTLKNLGMAYLETGDSRMAQQDLSFATMRCREKLGEEHPLTLHFRFQLAETNWKAKESKLARGFFREMETNPQHFALLSPSDRIHFHFLRCLDWLRSGEQEKAFSEMLKMLRTENAFWNATVRRLPEYTLLQLLKKGAKHTWFAISFLQHFFPGDATKAGEVYEQLAQRKALSFEVGLLLHVSHEQGENAALFEEFLQLRSELVRQVFNGPEKGETPEEFSQKTLQKEGRCQQLEQKLGNSIPQLEMDRMMRSFTLSHLSEKIPSDGVLVDFSVFRPFRFAEEVFCAPEHERLVALVLSPKAQGVRVVDLGEYLPLEKKILQFRRLLNGEGKTRSGQAAAQSRLSDFKRLLWLSNELYREIVQPLGFGETSAGNPGWHLIFCMDGALCRLPVEALLSGEDNFLLDGHLVSYVASPRELLRMAPASHLAEHEMALVFNPQFDLLPEEGEPSEPGSAKAEKLFRTGFVRALQGEGGQNRSFFPLQGSRREGMGIQSLLQNKGHFGVTTLSGKDALEKNFKALRGATLLHVATHGFFLEEVPGVCSSGEIWVHPLVQSGLVFGGINDVLRGRMVPEEVEDAILTGLDVLNLDLSRTALVTLSACETGLGEIQKGQGTMGIGRAFALSGAQTVLMSLWRVSDEHTGLLMESFYRHVLEGRGRAEALREAQLERIDALFEQVGFASPALWAGFICSGDWRAL